MTNSIPSELRLPLEEGESSMDLADKEKLRKVRTKAAREKARREKMNERFSCLANMSNPDDPKTDKASILMDTIRAFKSLQLENDQLRQLNKFLEERVTFYEKERNLAFYQQSLMFNAETPHTFSLPPQDGLYSAAAAGLMDFENRGTVTGTPVVEGTQDSCPENQNLCDPWLPDAHSSALPDDDFLHPPAA
eukprot:g3063.t1